MTASNGTWGRRALIKSGIVASAAGVLPAVATAKNGADDSSSGSGSGTSAPGTTPWVVPLSVYTAKQPVSSLSPAPGVAPGVEECGRVSHQRWSDWTPNVFYEMRVKEASHSFHPELPTQQIWGYDGIVPGPTFVCRYNEPVVVRIYNDLPASTVGFGSPEISTHLHNLHTPSESDGYTGDYFSRTKFGPTLSGPGAYKDHFYKNCYAGYDKYHDTDGDTREALGTLWYHDHRQDFTAPNVYRGLTGFYLMFDEIDSGNEQDTNPKALRLPSGVGKYDVPLVLTDKMFDSSGYVVFDQFNTDGILGNKFCVNGKIQPYFKVERRKYRFRILDGGPSRMYELCLTNKGGTNQPFTYIANDGNLLPAPLTMTSIRLGVAERADLVIDFSKYPVGTQLFLVNRLEMTNGRGPTGKLLTPPDQLLRFEVDREPDQPDPSQVPAKLRDLPSIDLKEVVQNRSWNFDRSNGAWTVNGKLFDVLKPAASPKLGTAEIWTLKNTGNWTHPIHIHFEEGRILSRNGAPPPAHEVGRKDVYVINPNEEIKVFLRFRDFTGKFMMHCHNLVHEDHAMMVRWDIVP